jgi:hypothetical protein
MLPSCGHCGNELLKAWRVEREVRYCQACYVRLFKRRLCGGCGMFKRLLASKDNARCQNCQTKQPCIRCHEAGRPIGKLTQYGPVCAGCRPYFRNPSPCDVCGEATRWLGRLTTPAGDRQACPRCRRSDHRTCSTCRRHRLCEPSEDGAWLCRLCSDEGLRVCGTCAGEMPAGLGSRCTRCYWVERCNKSAALLAELLRSARVRESFAGFAAWLPDNSSPGVGARRLKHHVEFFEALDSLGDVEWTAETLLGHFGTAALRRYALPMQWMGISSDLSVDARAKADDSDKRRLSKALSSMHEGSLGREVLKCFCLSLQQRCDSGTLTVRSARLAVRPAAALLTAQCPSGSALPTQQALDSYLAKVPGQRAAVSTFLGFLKRVHDLELKLPAKRSANGLSQRKALEKQLIAILVKRHGGVIDDPKWAQLALRYFHRMTAAEAKATYEGAARRPEGSGLVLSNAGQDYWLPGGIDGWQLLRCTTKNA